MENQPINPLRNPEEYQDEVLDCLGKIEVLMGDLYMTYAQKFSEYNDFWSRIAQEETAHAFWIKTLGEKIGGGKVFFNEERFKITPIKIFMDEISKKIETAKNEQVDIIEALSASIEIENSALERNFFEIFESDSAEIKDTFEKLRLATTEHRERVENFWQAERAAGRIEELNKKNWIWKKIKSLFS